jgi:peptidoglycan/xylan/chitin deacetylase (PgdA/CDA1 family)
VSLSKWFDKKQKRWLQKSAMKSRSFENNYNGVVIGLFCDFEGHYTGLEDGINFAESGTDLLLSILKKHDLKITFDAVADLCVSHPERVKKVVDAGHEIASHACFHETPRNLDRKQVAEMLEKAQQRYTDFGLKVTGFRSPESGWSMALVKELPKHGFTWSAERGKLNVPYQLTPELVRIDVAADDWPIVVGQATAEEMFASWESKVEKIAQAGGGVICFGVHEWIVGRYEDYAQGLDKFIEKMLSSGQVKFSKMGDIAHRK